MHVHDILRRWDAAKEGTAYQKEPWRSLRASFESAPNDETRREILTRAENLCRTQGGTWPPAAS